MRDFSVFFAIILFFRKGAERVAFVGDKSLSEAKARWPKMTWFLSLFPILSSSFSLCVHFSSFLPSYHFLRSSLPLLYFLSSPLFLMVFSALPYFLPSFLPFLFLLRFSFFRSLFFVVAVYRHAGFSSQQIWSRTVSNRRTTITVWKCFSHVYVKMLINIIYRAV